MSGHSKWHTIRHKKALTDVKKGKIFTKLSRELVVASKLGGENPLTNYRLRLAIDKAKSANMPNNKIDLAIQKGSGNLKHEKDQYEDILYEAYGPEGVAFLIQVLTDNRNRIVSEIRGIFTRNGGHLAESGSVLWMFERLAIIVIPLNTNDVIQNEESILDEICEFNLFDFKQNEEEFIIYSKLEDFEDLKNILRKKFTLSKSEIRYVPKNIFEISEEKMEKVILCYDQLDQNLDVQAIYWNLDLFLE